MVVGVFFQIHIWLWEHKKRTQEQLKAVKEKSNFSHIIYIGKQV